jgi:L-asparaginase
VGDPLSPMTAQAFANACVSLIDPIIANQYPDLQIVYVTDLSFPESKYGTLDSTNLQPTDWCILASYILKNYPAYDGWVVLHGTDSMDFTGTALPFLLSSFSSDGILTGALSKPVVITGSQMPMFYQAPHASAPSALIFNTDAFQNFCGAIAAAQTGIPEVCVYFQNHLYRGNRVVKTNASEFNAFSSPNYPALAEYGIELAVVAQNVLPPPLSYDVSMDNPSVVQTVRAQLAYIAESIDNVPVMQLNAFPAKYSVQRSTALLANLITACVAQGIKGLILESYGEGNFPSGNPDSAQDGATYKALYAANQAGVIIVDCTQVLRGVVNDSAYLAGAWLPEVGALAPADMTPMAAFAKLMVLMAAARYQKWTAADVKRLFQLNLLGEMMEVSRLDSRTNDRLLGGQTLHTADGSAVLTNDAARGPVLEDSEGRTLWSAIASPRPADLPGQLIMQNDGNLVFYSRNNAPLWATNTGISTGSSSQLILSGSTSDHSVSLRVYSYSSHTITKVLYPY